jgi:hypothetical protein
MRLGTRVRFATDDRVTVTDPKHWNYGEHGIVEDYDYEGRGSTRRYLVSFDGRDPLPFTVEQLDFTEGSKDA